MYDNNARTTIYYNRKTKETISLLVKTKWYTWFIYKYITNNNLNNLINIAVITILQM